MRATRLLIALFAVAGGIASGTAQAVICNIVFDRANAVVYQDVVPPVDMSERGAAARARMRQRGEQLMIIETEQCPRLVFSTIANSASVDEIVAGMRPYIGVSGGMGSSARPGASGAVAAVPTAPTQAPVNVAPARY
jgi:hypothetical protein